MIDSSSDAQCAHKSERLLKYRLQRSQTAEHQILRSQLFFRWDDSRMRKERPRLLQWTSATTADWRGGCTVSLKLLPCRCVVMASQLFTSVRSIREPQACDPRLCKFWSLYRIIPLVYWTIIHIRNFRSLRKACGWLYLDNITTTSTCQWKTTTSTHQWTTTSNSTQQPFTP